MAQRIDFKTDLISKFRRALQDARDVADNFFLSRLDPIVEEIASLSDEFGTKSQALLSKLLNTRDVALDETRTREFIQTLGEVHFYALCKRHRLDLERIPETTHQTPDFRITTSPKEHFEVKTLCIVGGEPAIKRSIEESLDERVQTQDALASSGGRVALFSQIIAPYGSVKLECRVKSVIRLLQNKLRQNLKTDQFSNVPTYLVVNLSMLSTFRTTGEILRPTYVDTQRNNTRHPTSGELWMVAFSKPGMLIQSAPEFEGKPSIEGSMQSNGILIESAYVAGIIFLAYDLSGQCRPLALVRSGNELTENIHTLVGNNWNDANDTNGYALSSQ